jgi:Family of unknown function (DUF5690)
VYLCDSFGYLGSVLLIFYKEFQAKTLDFASLLLAFSELTAIVGLVLVLFQFCFFELKFLSFKNQVALN